jgi:hypothetical protein
VLLLFEELETASSRCDVCALHVCVYVMLYVHVSDECVLWEIN